MPVPDPVDGWHGVFRFELGLAFRECFGDAPWSFYARNDGPEIVAFDRTERSSELRVSLPDNHLRMRPGALASWIAGELRQAAVDAGYLPQRQRDRSEEVRMIPTFEYHGRRIRAERRADDDSWYMSVNDAPPFAVFKATPADTAHGVRHQLRELLDRTDV